MLRKIKKNKKFPIWIFGSIFVATDLIISLTYLSQKDPTIRAAFFEPEKEQTESSRALASSENANECFLDGFTHDKLLSEIAVLEKNWKAPALNGSWNGFNYQKLKPSEAAFLNQYGEWVNTNSTTSTCSTLPCILKAPYESLAGDQGEKIYLWFLKMGYGLSVKDKIPDYANDPNRSAIDYYFPESELDAFWKVSHVLPSKYSYMQLLNTFHRFPNGTRPAKGEAGRYNSEINTQTTTTTLNGQIIKVDVVKTKLPGVIFLTQSGLSSSSTELSGYYFAVVIHEMTHALDNTYGPDLDHLSTQPDWYEISWKSEEVSTDGVVQKKLSVDPDKEGFLNPYSQKEIYSKSSVSEDFAEAGAHFVLFPDGLKQSSPKKFAYFKDKIYSGESFDTEALDAAYSSQVQLAVGKKISDLVLGCQLAVADATQPMPNPKLLNLSRAIPQLPQAFEKCIEIKTRYEIARKIASIKQTELQGCGYFKNPHNSAFVPKVAEKLKPEFVSALVQLNSLKQLQIDSAELKKRLNDECHPLPLYFANYKKENAKTEFESAYQSCLNRLFDRYADTRNAFPTLFQGYFENNSFERVADRMRTLYLSRFLNGIEVQLKDAAEKLWNQCKVDSSPADSLLLTPYDGGPETISENTLNCINRKYQNTLRSLVRSQLAQTESSPSFDSLEYSTDLVGPIFNQELNEQAKKTRLLEAILFDSKRESIKLSQVELLQNDTTYLKASPINIDEFVSDCDQKTAGSLEQKILESIPQTVANSISEWRMELSDEICRKVFFYRESLL